MQIFRGLMTAAQAASLLLLLPSALGRSDTCSTLAENTDIDVAFPLSFKYISEQSKYWSTSCSSLKPSCIIFPTSADDVSAILKAISEGDEDFAIKSGGHNPNNYFSSVAGGPLISTARLNQAVLDAETGVLQMGPGNRLDDIAEKLQGSGWTFVGGRIGNTGTGGLILGGGLSYMSAQYGWAASSALEFEVVLANGTIVNASDKENADLARALRGGGNNFGVVTRYTLQTYRQGNIWAGNVIYIHNDKVASNLLRAVRDFTEYNTDDRAAVIVTAERSTGLVIPELIDVSLLDTWILFLFYDGPTPPADVFRNFTEAGVPLLNTAKTRTYSQFIGGSNWVVVKGSVVEIGTETIPLPPREHAETVMEGVHAHWREVSGRTLLEPGIIASIAYQPFPRSIARQARARAPDLIDADDDAHRLILELNYSFLPRASYARMADTLEATYDGVRRRVLAWQEQGLLPDVYCPVFMNYGFSRVDYWGRLRPESRAFARQVADRYDPDGLFRNRTGGWKP
ncbi:putative FAD binding domain-containing protein [Rosellinia necatrix]|uniref:Putative FAD binding domain-containing protein n=1 Tax=Rosellinia necatrix TaxID=77044 RepID=A0A1W2TGW1_ROSNE|nr:putative FAD binding domain-containing protein [Rosellinia necatrix]